MASNINTSGIDTTYPIAGQDNDTQGFRNNFTNIAYNLNVAALEITGLQANIVSLPTYSGNVQNLAVAGNLTTYGAKIDAGYQYYAPTTNFSYTINSGVSRFIMDPTGSITNGAVTLPSANVDATVVTISSTQTVTNFQVDPNPGTTLVPSANITLTAGTGVTYFYHASETKWYKVA